MIFKTIFILAILTTSTAFSAPQAPGIFKPYPREAQKPDNPEQELNTVAVIGQIIEALKSETGHFVWPGYDISKSPVIITFRNGHIYAFNLISENQAWQPKIIKGHKVHFASNDVWGLTRQAMNPKFPIDGQLAFVFKIDMMKGDPIHPFMVFVHERFHHHQFSHFAIAGQPLEGYRDHLNSGNLALVRLEDFIIKDFAESQNSEESAKELLKDFISVNQLRLLMMQSCSTDWEMHQQQMEGLADYVSYRIFDVFPIFQNYHGIQCIAEKMVLSSKRATLSDHAIKWRHYNVGATLGYALDFLKVPDWKKKIEKQGMPLIAILEEAFDISPEEALLRAEIAKVRYGFDQFEESISNFVNQYNSRMDIFLKKYQEMDGIIVQLKKPQGIGISGGGSSKGTFFLRDSRTISLEDESFSATGDNSWTLRNKRLPFLFQGGIAEKEFKVETDAKIIIDKKVYSLEELIKSGKPRSFTSLSWMGRTTEFKSEGHPGTVSIDNGKILISYNQQKDTRK